MDSAMDSAGQALKGLGSKVINLIVWIVISLVISFLVTAVTEAAGGGGSGGFLGGVAGGSHEAAMAACVVPPESLDVRLEDVGGLARIKEELFYSLLLPLRRPELFFRRRSGFPATRGVLLTGPPGCGKTLMMKAVCKTSGCAFLCPTLAALQSKFFGESQKLLSAMFAVARKRAPCLIFIDEIDAAFRTRGEDDGCDYTFKTEFLSLMDGLRTREEEAVVVVGATNNPAALDPALLRRLPTVLRIDPPTAEERRQIVRLACREEPESAVSFEALEDGATDGFSGSDLAEVHRAASRLRLRALLAAGGVRGLDGGALRPLGEEEWRSAVARLAASKQATQAKHCHRPAAATPASLVGALRDALVEK